MSKNKYIKFGDSSSSDTLDIVASKTSLYIEIDSPWYGSSETGFGVSLNYDLNKEQATQLRDFINLFLDEK